MLSLNPGLNPSLNQLEPESRGEFTLNPARAAEHLRHLQLPGPDHFLLKLVQAGVAAGAAEIRVKIGWFGLEIDIALAECLPLEDLSSYLLRQDRPGLRYLAIGVNAALSSVRAVTLEQAGKRLVVTRKSQWEEKVLPQPGLRIGLARNRWDTSSERRLLTDVCCWCPVPLAVNGHPVQIPSWGSNATLVQSYVPGHSLSAPATSRALSPPRVPSSLAGRRIPCDMVLALESHSGPGIVYFVQHGVTVCQRRMTFGQEGVVAVVGADNLPTDLGGFEVLDGEALEERIVAVRVELEKMSRRT